MYTFSAHRRCHCCSHLGPAPGRPVMTAVADHALLFCVTLVETVRVVFYSWGVTEVTPDLAVAVVPADLSRDHCGLNLKGTRAFRVFPYYFLYACACTAIPGVCGYRIQQLGAHVKNLIAMGRGTILGELPRFSAFHCRIKGQTSKNPIEKVWDPLAKTTWPN